MDVGVPRCWNGSLALVRVALVDPQRGGQTTSSTSQGAAAKSLWILVTLDPIDTKPWNLETTYVQQWTSIG
ncbi:jg16856 [Pararge aegeria aegeria]|uniref:Jg16856 protein n=1 Tax=Pararge aegeria aegeria TaxID=348720 RepID=A0A8S4SQL2_9NEOP|nr:jg16856 [Pararge aegeria aegeria]